MQEYPLMLYRDGDMLPEHGVDYLVVQDEAERAEALRNGWRMGLDPLDHDGDGTPGGSLSDDVAPRRRGRPRKA